MSKAHPFLKQKIYRRRRRFLHYFVFIEKYVTSDDLRNNQ